MKPMLLDKGKGLFHQGWLSVHQKVPPLISLWTPQKTSVNALQWTMERRDVGYQHLYSSLWFFQHDFGRRSNLIHIFFLNQVISLSNYTLDLTFQGIIHPQKNIKLTGQLPLPPVGNGSGGKGVSGTIAISNGDPFIVSGPTW